MRVAAEKLQLGHTATPINPGPYRHGLAETAEKVGVVGENEHVAPRFQRLFPLLGLQRGPSGNSSGLFQQSLASPGTGTLPRPTARRTPRSRRPRTWPCRRRTTPAPPA